MLIIIISLHFVELPILPPPPRPPLSNDPICPMTSARDVIFFGKCALMATPPIGLEYIGGHWTKGSHLFLFEPKLSIEHK